ncbi:BON domain-containing protein [uncultured Thiohalocapsa sp.]|uniref:BON domain-containing protein n=1 Tax=uncultured Thiohalocapsa sp. TaxID=768990 RepID=UPI0025F723BF|nr:BON domain-containing protein [uncultured Thiohalocapsa sp.]
MSQSRLARLAATVAAVSVLSGVAVTAMAETGAAARAQTLIDVNPLLSGHDIRVRATDSGLRLEGAVVDTAERRLAVALTALVAASAEIDNALTLDADLPRDPGALFREDEDATTAARLRQTLRWQRDTAALDVALEVNRGEVRLNGDVGTTATKDRVAALAATTEGVDAVFNYMSVDPANIVQIRERQAELEQVQRPDAWITRRLRRLLQFDTTVNAHSIEVEAREGTAILSGAVTSSAERKVAEDLASNMPGVRDLDSRLVIERPR